MLVRAWFFEVPYVFVDWSFGAIFLKLLAEVVLDAEVW
jgi:hypothetical protein